MALGGLDVHVSSFLEHRTVRSLAKELTRRLRRERPQVLSRLYSQLSYGDCCNLQDDEEEDDDEDEEVGSVVSGAGSEASRRQVGGSVMKLRARQLEGWRGLLIIWVLLEHYLSEATRAKLGRRFGANTSIFCILSGLACAVQFYQAPSLAGFKPLAFLRSRALGLYPILYLALLVHLPRYFTVRRYKDAYWEYPKTGRLGTGTDYSQPATYLWDLLWYGTGMQTWCHTVHKVGVDGSVTKMYDLSWDMKVKRLTPFFNGIYVCVCLPHRFCVYVYRERLLLCSGGVCNGPCTSSSLARRPCAAPT